MNPSWIAGVDGFRSEHASHVALDARIQIASFYPFGSKFPVASCRELQWFVVLVNNAQGRIIETRHHISRSFKDVLNLTPAPKVIAIDIPIGLLDTPEIGGRECDREARRLLKHPRVSSVFSPPIRKYLPAQNLPHY